jgi:hypothetical protein
MPGVHRLNPNGMLVLVGSVMYAIAGGPVIVAGGFAIGLALILLHRPGDEPADRGLPPSLFGTREPSSTHIRVVTALRVHRVFACAPAIRTAARR